MDSAESRKIISGSVPNFMLLSNIEKQTIFNYVCSAHFFRMSSKILKSESKLFSLPEMGKFLSAEFLVSGSFDV